MAGLHLDKIDDARGWLTTRISCPDLVPDLDEGLGLRIAPGEPGFFEIVRAKPPLLTPLKGPIRDDTPVSEGVEDRSVYPRAR
jgi:hypothetical protein